jgi:hypothetical protein
LKGVVLSDVDIQPSLELSSDGVTRYVWHTQFGEILIEVFADDLIAVNGKKLSIPDRAKATT